MNRNQKIQQVIHTSPVIPVLVIKDLSTAIPLAKALVNGGLKVLEVTLRHPAALEAISMIQDAVPEAIVGAGTVLNEYQLSQLDKLKCQFAVSPGVSEKLLANADQYETALLPGVNSASQIMQGLEYDYQAFKFFPAEASGGIAALKAFAGPFDSVEFCPTGGVGADNFQEYLSLPNVTCVGGTWVAPEMWVQQEDWNAIEALARQVVVMTKLD